MSRQACASVVIHFLVGAALCVCAAGGGGVEGPQGEVGEQQVVAESGAGEGEEPEPEPESSKCAECCEANERFSKAVSKCVYTLEGYPGEGGGPHCQPDETWLSGCGCITTEPAAASGPRNVKVLARIVARRIRLLDRVLFEFNSPVLQPGSHPILDQVAQLLEQNAELCLVEVQNHTDNRGSRAYNYELSNKRARTIRNYLEAKGVDSARLVPRGYGPDRPIHVEGPDALRQTSLRSRRSEIVVLECCPTSEDGR